MAGAESPGFGLHGLDLACAAYLAVLAYRGYTRGLFQEVMRLIAFFAAMTAAYRWTPDIVPRFADAIPGPSFFDTAFVFSSLFIVVGTALRILASIVGRSPAGDSSANRFGGVVFGFTKGAMIIGSTVLMLRTFTPTPANGGGNAMAGPLQALNGRIEESIVASELAELSSGLFSALVDAAEIRLRMLATSDNEGP